MLRNIIFTVVYFSLVIGGSATLQSSSADQASIGRDDFSFSLTLTEKNCQIAIWLTNAQGKFIDTLYVTRKTGQKGLGNRGGGLDDKWGGSRLSLLPVWAHQRGVDYGGGNYYPPKEKPLADAISSATPKAGIFEWRWRPIQSLPPGVYHYFIEVNKSFDQNDPHDYSWYRGQPSVVWQGSIEVGARNTTSQAQIVGHGHVAGADGRIDPDLSTLTSALKLLSAATAAYQPGK